MQEFWEEEPPEEDLLAYDPFLPDELGFLWARSRFNAPRYLAYVIRGGVYAEHIRKVLQDGVESYYLAEERPKKSGGTRILLKPQGMLKHIQSRIYKTILRGIGVQPACHGYTKGRSIVTNAVGHVASTHMMAIDLDNAFSHVTRKRVSELLQGTEIFNVEAGRYSHRVEIGWYLANLIAYLCTTHLPDWGVVLPQGAPTSPTLFNLACRDIDRRLGKFCQHNGIVYTRYVDNLYLSRGRPFTGKEYRVVENIVEKSGFLVNDAKTRMMQANPHSVLRLPGVVISGGELRAPRKTVRELRAAVYHALRTSDWDKLNGLLGYVKQIYGGELPPQIRQALRPRQLAIRLD